MKMDAFQSLEVEGWRGWCLRIVPVATGVQGSQTPCSAEKHVSTSNEDLSATELNPRLSSSGFLSAISFLRFLCNAGEREGCLNITDTEF